MIVFEQGDIQVDVSIISEGLGIDPELVQQQMRDGEITSLLERGVDEDAGRHRLTFFSKTRRFRLIVDDAGNEIKRSVVDFGEHPLPASARKPGV